MINLRRTYFNSKSVVLVSILLLALLSWTAFWIYTQVTLNTTEQALSGELKQQARYRFDTALQRLDNRAAEIEQLAGQIASQTSTASEPSINTLLAQALRWSDDLEGAAFFDHWPSEAPTLRLQSGGQALAASPVSPPWLQQLPDAFTDTASAGTSWWSPSYRHPASFEPIITLVQPVLSANGQISGLISLDWKVDAILQHAGIAEATPGTLVWLTDSLNLQLAPRYNDARQAYADSLMRKAQAQIPQTVFLTEFEQRPLSNAERPTDLYYAPTRSGLQLTAAIPRAELIAPVTELASRGQTHLYMLGGVIVLLTLAGLALMVPVLLNLRVSDQDKLTGLPNRVRLLQDLVRDNSVSLILVNLDRFRELNSLFGDDCGDLVLREVALRLQSFMSIPDNQGGKLYRVSGDEFALSLPRRRPELVQAQLEQILNSVREHPISWQNHEIGLSATVGAAVPWYESPKEHSLYIHAREALREARAKGLHCLVFDGTEPLEQTFEHNQKWAGKLREALDAEGLVAWFQPILNNTTGRIDKYECLVRMLDTDGEVVSPGKFLEVAGKLRLEGHITRIMVEKCFARFADSPMQFSINLSYSDLQQEELTRFILERLDETGVGPRVIFELLESANIENYDQVRHFIVEVKKRGCRIAIDDFGTGYSSFEHLLQLKVDFIKVDGSLIRNLDSDPNSRRVVRGIVGLARSMKIETVAEFVHSEAIQMEVLRLGISFSQGELIGMPAPEPLVNIPKELTKLSYSGRNQARSAVKV